MKKLLALGISLLMIILQIPGIAFAQNEAPPPPYSKDDLKSIVNNYAFYDPSAICDSGAVQTGSAVAALRAQTKLDSRWAVAITEAAKTQNADPLAMAAVLWWEHRGFPAYGAGPSPGESDSVGRGPWQITRDSWPSSFGSYETGAYDPAIATKAAAQIVKSKGGTPGLPIGAINQAFARGNNIPSIASFAKNYNAGQATWRDPSVADWHAGNRTWMQGGQGAWGSEKQGIIDDYIVGATYVYFQMAKGQQIAPFGGNASYDQEALKHIEEMRNFVFRDSGNPTPGTSNTEVPVTTTNPGCAAASGGAVQGNIVATALNYAWDTPSGHGPNESDAKQPYRQDMPRINGSTGSQPFSDCGVFVSTVLRASGADPNYPKRGTGEQIHYIRTHPDKWQIFDHFTNTSQLQPGDVMIFDGGGDGTGHTYIYTGPYTSATTKKVYNAASASWGDHVPQAEPSVYFDQGGHHFSVARLTANVQTNAPRAQ